MSTSNESPEPAGSTGPRGTQAFSPASRGGEQRVRTAARIARRVANAGLRYRLREFQLLAVPCAVAFAPVFGSSAGTAAFHPLIPALALCMAFLAVNAGLSFGLPWVDQHAFPVLAMLVASHYALATASVPPLGDGASFPISASIIALYASLGVRLVQFAVPPFKPGRSITRAPARHWPLWLGTALLVAATVLVTLAAGRRLLA